MNDNGKKRWLIVPIEVQVREIYARSLIAAVAADRGYDVVIGHDRVVRRLAGKLPKGVLYDKALGVATDRKLNRYHRLGYKLTATDEEQTGLLANPAHFLSTRMSQEAFAKAQRWFAISNRVRDVVTTHYPEHAQKIVTTGLPRTDIWRKPFQELYGKERDAIRAKYGPYILFCSNFGSIVHARRGRFVEQQVRRHEKHYTGAIAYREKLELETGLNLDAFVEILPMLRRWFPNHRLIIRPHPSEDLGFWHSVAARADGIEVVFSGVAAPWILGSDCLVHHGCTTGIEAELMGKAQIMYAPHRDDHHDTPQMFAFSHAVKELDQLRAAIGSLLDDPDALRKNRHDLEEWFASLDGKLVAEHIVDEFDKIPLTHQAEKLPWLAPLRFSPRHLVAQYWPKSAKAAKYARQKWQGTTLAAMRDNIAVMQRAAPLQHDLAVEEIFPQLYHVRRA